MNLFEVVLTGIFALGTISIVAGLVAGVVLRSRDKRTKEERAADEYGDMAPDSAKITPGFGANQIGGLGH